MPARHDMTGVFIVLVRLQDLELSADKASHPGVKDSHVTYAQLPSISFWYWHILAMLIQFHTVWLNILTLLYQLIMSCCLIYLLYSFQHNKFLPPISPNIISQQLSKKLSHFKNNKKHVRETTGCGSKSCQPRLSFQVFVWNKWFSKLSTTARLLGTPWLLAQEVIDICSLLRPIQVDTFA